MYPFASVSHFISGYPISWKYFESRDINNLMASQQRNYAFIIHFYRYAKLRSNVPYMKAIKKSKVGNQSTAVPSPHGAKKPFWGLPMGWKIKVPKYSHIIYQSIANFMYSQKNIRTICSKLLENPLREKQPPEAPHRKKN